MKKILFAIAAMTMLSFAACGNKAGETAETAADSTEVAVDSLVEVVDSVAADTVAVAE